MKKREEETYGFLEQFGKIGQLRKRLVSLLISVEDMYADLKATGENTEEIVRLAKKIELLLGEFAMSQQMADRMIVGLKPGDRKTFLEEIPEILEVFGWQNKFDEDGNLMEDA